MKRATTLKVLAGTLVLIMVASAFPLAQVAITAAEEREAKARDAAAKSRDDALGADDLPFLPPDGSSSTDGTSTSPNPLTPGGTSSRPGSQAPQDGDRASGSVLVQQVTGAARLMGLDVPVPALPVDKLAAENPLSAALVAWVAATGSQVPPEELAAQIERANALPQPLQRDLALLVLSAAEATLLQHEALARLTPEEIAWIYTHPEVAERMARHVEDDETRKLALLATQVDMTKSIQSSLLLLQAVEATRGGLQDYQARAALQGLQSAELDASTAAVLALLLQGSNAVTDQEKVLFAARVVSTTAGVPMPGAPVATSFEDAVSRLLASASQTPDPAELRDVLARADALPLDLQLALARVLVAEANAIDASNPARYTPEGQATALAAMLVAIADSLPTLEKYNLYWRNAPEALRIMEWTPSLRAGWAAEHAALLVSANGDASDLVRAGAIIGGEGLVPVSYPRLTVMEAYARLSVLAGAPLDDATRAQAADAVSRLDSDVRDAAAIMLSGAYESARLQREAWSELTPEEKQWLLVESQGIDALYAKARLSDAELATLRRASLLAERVDQAKLASASAIATRATLDAKELLAGADAFAAQGAATPVETGLLAFLKRLLPWGSASAQGSGGQSGGQICGETIEFNCDGTLLRLPLLFAPGDFAGLGGLANGNTCIVSSQGCVSLGLTKEPGQPPCPPNAAECTQYFNSADRTLLLITDGSDTFQAAPELGTRQTCSTQITVFSCTFSQARQHGSPVVAIDLDGDDTYARPVAVTLPDSPLPVALQLEMGGADVYLDPSASYDDNTHFPYMYGRTMGHPTQGSAFGGGVAVLVDAEDEDVYNAATRSQGFGRYGAGVLADLGGTTDVYTAKEVTQGASSDTFNLGVGVLLDLGGDDRYSTQAGQGYGLGGVLLDLGGEDGYANPRTAMGAPLVKLDLLPGGDLSSVDERGNNRIWLDGPGSLNPGLAIDTELILSNGDTDDDGFADFVEFALGTNPEDFDDSPNNRATARADAVLDDADRDGYPTYVERALSTDPEDATSYPAGLPANVVVVLPASVTGALDTADINLLLAELEIGYERGSFNASQGYAGATNLTASDKILDLRLPLQDAGSIEPACAPVFLNNTGLLGVGGANLLQPINQQFFRPQANGDPAIQCVNVGYTTRSPGEGNATTPGTTTGSANAVTFSIPAGILAIGDLVDTRYAADYYLVIDLGGSDTFSNSAGGGLLVGTRGAGTNNALFVAPSVVVNVDPSGAPAADRYANASRAYAQGSLLGVLVDNAGDDEYVAGDGSQGALGGVLLDLAGNDTYTAGDLAQGASLASLPSSSRSGLPEEGATPQSNVANNATGDGPARRMAPGLLADLGEGDDVYTAGAHSQGFSRGYSAGAPTQRSGLEAAGLLLDAGGDDFYDTMTLKGRNGQGVAGLAGLGALVDLAGSDTYRAYGVTSQGATISQLVGAGETARPQAMQPATGVLIDLAEGDADGADAYTVLDPYRGAMSRAERNTNLTITRSETGTIESGNNPAEVGHVYADLGIHLDGSRDGAAALDGISGVGANNSAVQDDARNYLVDLPTARLAIGDETPTAYDREYALVIDLGGRNSYNFTAGGFIPDVLLAAQMRVVNGVPTSGDAPSATIFPVTFVLDVAGDSTYRSNRSLSQGAGFFSVGVLADLGGKDQFMAVPSPLPVLRSDWTGALDPFQPREGERVPAIDAAIASDWDGVTPQTILLGAVRDPTNQTAWTLRTANDDTSLYLALQGQTSSRGANRTKDLLTIDLDTGRRGVGWDNENNRTGVDQVTFQVTSTGACVVKDRAFNRTAYEAARASSTAFPMPVFVDDPKSARAGEPGVPDMDADCQVTDDGGVTIELRKRLIENTPRDSHDLGYCHNKDVGWGYALRRGSVTSCEYPARELGLHIRFDDAGAGVTTSTTSAPAGFTWPPGSTDRDGEVGYARGNGLGDEMARWAVVTLADKGERGDNILATRAPALAQGASLSGVGILAMLGANDASSVLTASERSQAYATFGGLAMLIDTGGSDRYVGTDRVQAAVEGSGVAVLFEVDGNDNYVARDRAYGWVPSGSSNAASAFLLELGGDDEYVWRARDFTAPPQAVLSSNSPYLNERLVLQNTTGVFLDYQLRDDLSNVASFLMGGSRISPHLTLSTYAPGAEGADPKTGCTTTPLPLAANTGKPVARGKVCLHALVDLSEDAPLGIDPNVGGAMRTASVDFLVGRERVLTLTQPTRTLANGATVWSVPVDFSDEGDGVTRVKAVPMVAVNTSRQELLFRSEPPQGEIRESDWVRVVIVDNAPEVDLRLAPAYNGLANATFSPYGLGGQQNLVVNWSVSHDADEERLNAYNGLQAPDWLSNVPCNAGSTQLCNILPLFLPQGQSEALSTQPGTGASGNIVTESGGGGTAFGRSTDTLRTPLVLTTKDTFHLALPNRTSLSLQRAEYNTSVRLTLVNELGQPVTAGCPTCLWYLQGPNSTHFSSAQGAVEARPIYDGQVKPLVGNVDPFEAVNDVLGTVQTGLVSAAVRTFYNAVCPASANEDACGNFVGDYGANNARFCRLKQANNPLNTVPYNTARNTPLCTIKVSEQLNATAKQVDGGSGGGDGGGAQTPQELAPAVGLAQGLQGDLEDAVFGTSGGSPANWRDLYFDLNATLPDAKWGIRREGDRVIIPAGYRLVFEFNVSSTGIGGDLLGPLVGDSFETAAGTLDRSNPGGTGDGCLATASIPGTSTPNAGRPPLDGRPITQESEEPACVSVPLDPVGDVADQVRQLRTSVQNVDNAANLRSIPVSFFFVGGGEPHDQARLELRVPAEPSTAASLTLETPTGDVAYTFRDGSVVEGDVPCSPVRGSPLWPATSACPTTGTRYTQRTDTLSDPGVPDGYYFVRVRASTGEGDDAVGTLTQDTVIVDKTAPRTYITTERFAGSGVVVDGQVPIKWLVDLAGQDGAQGTALNSTTILYRDNLSGALDDFSKWTRKGPYPDGTRFDFVQKREGNTYLIMGISLDLAGNLEGYVPEPQSALTLEQALREAFKNKLAQGEGVGYVRVDIDQGRPVASSVAITGGRALNYLGTEFSFVRAGAPVAFSVCANDPEQGIGRVNVSLDHIDPATQKLVAHSFAAEPNGACSTGGTRYTFSGWSSINRNRTLFPQGIWVVQFEVFDVAGNRIRIPGGSLILDHEAPTVRPEAPVLPLGQSAVKPGDRVSLRFHATDAFGVDDARLAIDAAALTNETNLTAHPVRVNGVIYQEFTFTVNRQGLQNKVYTVNVTVPDLAGNATLVAFHVPVDFKKFSFVEGSLRVTDVTHSSVVLRWNTTEPTAGGARFGTTTIAMNGRTPLDTNATIEHAVKIDNLAASTRYYLKAVSTSPSGFSQESDVLEVDTASALFLELLSPAKDASLSGPAKVAWKGGLLGSNKFVTYTVEVQAGEDKPWTFLTTLTRQGEAHEVTWNTSRYLDGSAYRLRLTAEAGRDVASRTIGPLTLDNTPASVNVLSPLIATSDTTPQILAEARDALSGLGAGSARLLIDGVPVVEAVSTEVQPDGSLRIRYDVPSALPAGARAFELVVTDRAGATARESWRATIDGDAPNATVNPTRFAPGTGAARQGGTVTLNLTLKDLSGVATAIADASRLSSAAPSPRLVKLVGTDTWTVTIPVTASDPSATKRVTINATDLAGNWRLVDVDVPVDNVAPVVPAASVSGVGFTSATLAAEGNEPILLQVTATAARSPPVTAATRVAEPAARLKLDGLLPSRSYSYSLTATDLAGNAATLAGSFETQKDVKPPTQVGPLSVLDLLNGTLRLSWAPAKDDVAVAFYRVYRSDDGKTFEPLAEVAGTSYDDAGLAYEELHTYKVAAVDHGGNEGVAEERLRAAATAVPRLSAALASPTVGSTQTTFRYTVTYVSPGGVAPATIRVILDGVPQDMQLISGEPETGAIYQYETRLAPHKRDEPHTYAFEASDGRYTALFPEDGSLLRGPLVSADALAEGEAQGFAAFAQRVPAGGAALTGVALLAAVAIAGVLLRRNKEGSK